MDFVQQAKVKAEFASSIEQCDYAISDCHSTLHAVQLPHEHPYSRKLWAEIDAYRDRKQTLLKGTK